MNDGWSERARGLTCMFARGVNELPNLATPGARREAQGHLVLGPPLSPHNERILLSMVPPGVQLSPEGPLSSTPTRSITALIVGVVVRVVPVRVREHLRPEYELPLGGLWGRLAPDNDEAALLARVPLGRGRRGRPALAGRVWRAVLRGCRARLDPVDGARARAEVLPLLVRELVQLHSPTGAPSPGLSLSLGVCARRVLSLCLCTLALLGGRLRRGGRAAPRAPRAALRVHLHVLLPRGRLVLLR